MSEEDQNNERMDAYMRNMTGAIIQLIERFRNLQAPLVETRDSMPAATKQLEKICEQTLTATDSVLERVERIMQRAEIMSAGLEAMRGKLPPDVLTEFGKLIETYVLLARDTLTDADAIIYALQFQDIITQQTGHAVALLEELRHKLEDLTMAITVGVDDSLLDGELQKRAFDPNADYSSKHADQAEVDSIFAKQKS